MHRRRRRSTALAALLAVLAVVASACVVPPSSLTVEVVVSGRSKPWDLAFTPDGTLLFTEKPGRINAVPGGTAGGPVTTMVQVADIYNTGEAGMMGLAVDPDFATNRRIYTCMGSTLAGSPDVRVVRWQVAPDYTSVGSRTDILTGIPVNTTTFPGRHAGCRLRFGPDGNLWVTTGDSAQPTVPQDPTSLGGKVLRIDTDGAPATGNPGPPLRPEIYSYGHRNPQGIAFRPSDGQPFTVEHGPGCDDEVNRLVAGGNYGWDPVSPTGTGNYYEGGPMTDLTKFPDAVPAVWSSGCPTIAPSGGGFLSGTHWVGWDDGLAVAVLKGQQLRVLTFNPAGTALTAQFVRVTDQGRLHAAVQGPDGNLYLAQDKVTDAAILRVSPPR